MRTSYFIRAALAFALLLAAHGIAPAQVRLSEAETKAAAITRPLPEYPVMARQLKVTGKVVLELNIAADGSVQEVKIISGSPMLTRPCAKVVSGWKFKPALQEGKPAPAVGALSFEFR